MIEINWNNFRVKFNNQEHIAFERLCYLLFCKEYGKDVGLFRFKNQAGIETNPIEKEGKFIGWQAKFYVTRLSEHKDDFLQSIDNTKMRHPEVNKIIFYTNQEFGQDKKKTDPYYKLEIENHAKSIGLEIEWRTASYFESSFVCEQCFSITQYFFSLGKGILDSIITLSQYAESLLKPIQSQILYNGTPIKLDRSKFLMDLANVSDCSSPIILNGGAGVGKTAVIKDFFDTIKDSTPFFVFKATQFRNISHINQLFKNFGEITATDFINEHNDFKNKFMVIDSAERLAEIEDQNVFRMFLSSLLENKWAVIFTVRYNYLDDLRFQLKEIYSVSFTSLNIPNLIREEVEKIAADYNFKLPQNDRLVSLFGTPLYLNEYLQSYTNIGEAASYSDFREIIWKKQIQDSTKQSGNIHRRRENCFLKIARERANNGGFFVNTENLDQEALQKLETDEIIKFDSNAGGYFITHDVYEEWALDKIIEQAFISAEDHSSFYNQIGNSLPIRRAFRNWLSDKLFTNDENAKQLIDYTIKDPGCYGYWKDEVIVSVLLSDYSEVFFELFETELLEEPEVIFSQKGSSAIVRTVSTSFKYENKLLHKILFLLRIACKTIDDDFLKLLGITNAGAVSLKTIFTKPKGNGWDTTIAFINKHKDKLQFRYMNAILPILDDWNKSRKIGVITRNASQIALFYYQKLKEQEGFYFSSRDETRDKLIRTILSGSGEIKIELTAIVDEIIATDNTSRQGIYYELAKVMLASVNDSSEVAKHLPEQIIKLANLFWVYNPKERDGYHFSEYRNDIEQYFDLTEGLQEYYPASAFQTPIFQLLQYDPQKTCDFILSFTNKSVEYFGKTEFAQYEAEEIDVVIDDSGETIRQYICHRIWNLYRGTQVAPPLLESIHMALEKWLLWVAKSTNQEVIESWCFYLLKNSHSASITATIASIVLAEPSKLFNVAKVLFRTKEFFFFDTARMQLDMTAKTNYSISHDPTGIFTNERIKTCEDKHRSNSLENLALRYQLFANEDETEEIAKQRQEILWKIFDEYYVRLPKKSKENDRDKTWRLYLARMDRRKMKIYTELKDDKVLISFNPEIDPELKQYSEDTLARSSEALKYISLQMWSQKRFEKNEDYKKYPQFENDVAFVVSEIKKVIKGLNEEKNQDSSFGLFYRSLPSYVCAVLLRDYLEKLNSDEIEFCKDILIKYASMPLEDNYGYQTSDGVDVAINSFPLLFKLFPENTKAIKNILLLTLLDAYPVSMGQQLSDYSIAAIRNGLWKENFIDANSIFLGFLSLKPKYDELRKVIMQKKYNSGYNISKKELLNDLNIKYKTEIAKINSNEIVYADIFNIEKVDLNILVTAFSLLPIDTTDETHQKFLQDIFPIFSKKVFTDVRRSNDEDGFKYYTKHRFLEKLAYMTLSYKDEEIENFLKPFLDDFMDSENTAEFLGEFISAEDKLAKYEQFWTVWKLFYPKILALAKSSGPGFYSAEIIRNYLLAWGLWKTDAKEWHTLKNREKIFFKTVSEDMPTPIVLYSISNLLTGIGSNFVDDGVIWISEMLKRNPNLYVEELEVNTIYYMENIVRGYIIKNRHKIKTTLSLKNRLLIILDFLLAKGSVTGYLLREDIL